LKRKIIITDDGSTSLELTDLKEHYHSTFGAIQEAQYVYLLQGLDFVVNQHQNNHISVFEMGFGTGLNAFLTYLYAVEHKVKIDYTAIEAFPLKADEVTQLNFVSQLKAENHKAVFDTFHTVKSDTTIVFSPFFNLKIHNTNLELFQAENCFNLIYFDAFGPDIQPELWTESIFKMLYQALKSQGILVTYSAKGSVRRALQAVGFDVSRIPGPPGKREMLRAVKPKV